MSRIPDADVSPIQQADLADRAVTSRRPGLSAAERKRRQRQRERQELVYERDDWQLFLDQATLSQKAGCHAGDIGEIVLKELVDNALDVGGHVTLTYEDGTWIVADDGPGIDPTTVPRLFSVNRPLLSSKLKRLPLRGMLGNGLRVVTGAVAAFDGTLVVETRGHRLQLAVNIATGKTDITADERILPRQGTVVRIQCSEIGPDDDMLASYAIAIAGLGANYNGPSSPWWYGAGDLLRLFSHVLPSTTTVSAVCADLGLKLEDKRPARELAKEEVAEVLQRLRAGITPLSPEKLGAIGPDLPSVSTGYALKAGVAASTPGGAVIPYVVEAWATCSPPQRKGSGSADIDLIINRSLTLAMIHASSRSDALAIQGCDLSRLVAGPKTGDYSITLSVIAPHVPLATDGKEPSLSRFSETIADVLRKACTAAHRAMKRRARTISIKDAAWSVMPEAYQHVSGIDRLPANARQIMYAARPDILGLTGKDTLRDTYFTQVLLPDYVTEHSKETEWNVIFDARGSFIEPQTGYEVPLGTLDVRNYLHAASVITPAIDVRFSDSYPTKGPLHRYSNVLFIEKEGFASLLKAARIAERFDVAIMSTKGMSVVAARILLDGLAPLIKKVLVLHDFDVSGFSIFGTLGTDGRRYTFNNDVPIVDIGLRLADIESLHLQSELVQIKGDWTKRGITLRDHGATAAEIRFLRNKRVELNALSSPQFIAFLEGKLEEHGVGKVIPETEIVEQQARRVLTHVLIERLVSEGSERIEAEAEAYILPDNLANLLQDRMEDDPHLPWDVALAKVIRSLEEGAEP